MFTDTHCHLYKEYYDNIDVIIKNANDNGITKMINCSTNIKNANEVISTSKKHNCVYAAIGIHPEDIQNITLHDLNIIEKNIENIVAIGEIGLDYHYENPDKEKQKLIFEEQLNIAEKYNKPVIIHSRDATNDMINILKKHSALKGVIHCFSGSYETAQIYIKMGFKIGIGGVLTFKNSKLFEVLDKLNTSDIVIETDSPYMTPVPYRGTKNEPKYISIVAKKICEIKKISEEELSKITEKNVKEIFDI